MELILGTTPVAYSVLELHRVGRDCDQRCHLIYFDRTDFRDLDASTNMTGLCERVFKMVNQMLANGYRVQTDQDGGNGGLNRTNGRPS